MQRHTIYDKRAFANVTKYIAGIIGSQVSPSSISKSLKSDNQDTHRRFIPTKQKRHNALECL